MCEAKENCQKKMIAQNPWGKKCVKGEWCSCIYSVTKLSNRQCNLIFHSQSDPERKWEANKHTRSFKSHFWPSALMVLLPPWFLHFLPKITDKPRHWQSFFCFVFVVYSHHEHVPYSVNTAPRKKTQPCALPQSWKLPQSFMYMY